MLTNNYLFQRMPSGITFLTARPILTDSIGTDNIVSIELYGKTQGYNSYRITLDSMTANQYFPGMKATIAGTSLLDGNWDITHVDSTNKQLIINCTLTDIQAPVPANTGTCTIKGTIDPSVINLGTKVVNNDNKIVGFSYKTSQSFLLDYAKDVIGNTPVAIQLNVIGAGTVTATVKWSLDNVHWMDFPTALTLSSTAAAVDGKIIADLPPSIKLRIDVTSNNVEYYLLAA